MVLPYDFLKHFGYGDTTINHYETITHNLQHIRVASTLRGANPLGAYLILPISALVVIYIKNKHQRKNVSILGAGLLLALFFSFSRSAWIGVLLSAACALWLSLKSVHAKKVISWTAGAFLAVVILLGFTLRNNLSFENLIFHTDRFSKSAISSNEGHVSAFKIASKDIVHEPLGRGVGSAGPQSIYNERPIRIAENYFLQIGQEAGVLGILLFMAICVWAGKMLLDRRSEPLALILFASLIGITFVNLLSHAWTDDTLAYIWWGLAAIALSPSLGTEKST
jgi:hypothetical protein